MKDINLNLAYSAKGKEIPIKNGMKLYPGSMLHINGKWITIDKTYLIQKSSSWNNLTQSKDISCSLILI